MFVSYLALASAGRFFAEFYRQPDPQIGFVAFGLTMGQVLSIAALLSVSSAVFLIRKNYAIIGAVDSRRKRRKSDMKK
jgi:phosphatidylglycerol:prolipoprotein diacylglycerol transferase